MVSPQPSSHRAFHLINGRSGFRLLECKGDLFVGKSRLLHGHHLLEMTARFYTDFLIYNESVFWAQVKACALATPGITNAMINGERTQAMQSVGRLLVALIVTSTCFVIGGSMISGVATQTERLFGVAPDIIVFCQ